MVATNSSGHLWRHKETGRERTFPRGCSPWRHPTRRCSSHWRRQASVQGNHPRRWDQHALALVGEIHPRVGSQCAAPRPQTRVSVCRHAADRSGHRRRHSGGRSGNDRERDRWRQLRWSRCARSLRTWRLVSSHRSCPTERCSGSASVAFGLPLALAAERQYVGRT